MTRSGPVVAQLLAQARSGDRAALDELIPVVYRELRRLARRHLLRQSPGHTLQTAEMNKLVPQIRYWLRTGFVAADKIISLQIPELYSMVRGEMGKTVEFGLTWGITRLRGGFLLGRLAMDRRELVDAKFAVKAVEDHIALLGKPPHAYAYDRAGRSEKNIKQLKELGVRDVGLAPRGKTGWAVSESTREKLVKERALVEAGIGAVKSSRYNFHRPRARSMRMMGACGQLALLGFNLNKLARGLAARRDVELVG
jgi:hypothetical protein